LSLLAFLTSTQDELTTIEKLQPFVNKALSNGQPTTSLHVFTEIMREEEAAKAARLAELQRQIQELEFINRALLATSK
jgi:hypothetical protein